MGFAVRRGTGRYAGVLAIVALGAGAVLAVAPSAQAASAPASARPSAGTALEWEFSGVSCTSASACTAVGDFENSLDATAALVERWNGTAWTVQSTPTPSGAAASYLNGVSCTSASACTAVGQYVTGAGTTATLAERWNGTAWTVQSTPAPSGATASFLQEVSCPSASACTAVGYYLASGTSTTFAERWNGTAWTLQSTPAPSGATASYLNGVSCPSASACTATGFYSTGTTDLTLAETWNGTAWTVQSTPAPSGATSSELYGVSCPSASACTAAGNYETSTGATVTLAESWNGTAWTVQSTPSPSGAIAAFLDGVSCPAASSCTASGWYQISSGAYETLAETWNGTAWTVQSTPNPSGATDSYLFGVSCPSVSACAAVGYDLNSTYKSLAEGWNGTAWALQSTPTP
jgi:hypothetical protein